MLTIFLRFAQSDVKQRVGPPMPSQQNIGPFRPHQVCQRLDDQVRLTTLNHISCELQVF